MAFDLKEIPKPRGTAAELLEAKGSTVFSVGPQDTVYEAISRMNDHRVGALLVMDASALVGIISERDYTRKVVLLGRSSRETQVADIMTPKVVTITRDTSLSECMHIVTRQGFRHLPVMEGERVVGMLSIGDMVRAVLAQQMEMIERLNAFIGSDYPT